MFPYFGDVIRNSRQMGAILIFTPDHGYVYLSVLQTVCEVKIRKLKGLGVLPLLLNHNRGTSVTFTYVGSAIYKGSVVKQILATYQSCLVGNVWSWAQVLVCLVDTFC